jgi:DegV family protein with EDD domain
MLDFLQKKGKKMKIKISADSTCDLSSELLEQYDISTIPLYIVDGENSFKDGIEITPQDIYNHVQTTGKLYSTAAVSVADYYEYFQQILKQYDGLVHLTISSDMSACYQNACLAASEFENVYVVDARNLSTGIGHLALRGRELAETGLDAREVAAQLERDRERLDVSFIVDTLVYLHKGGRCSSIAALGANLLSLKPCIEVHKGVMGVGKKYRGALKKCLVQYVRDRLAGRDDIDTSRIFITESGVSQEIYEAVYEAVKSAQPFAEILHTQAGCTISNHCGPNCLGILYFHKEPI